MASGVQLNGERDKENDDNTSVISGCPFMMKNALS
jgi:hypothetical protein